MRMLCLGEVLPQLLSSRLDPPNWGLIANLIPSLTGCLAGCQFGAGGRPAGSCCTRGEHPAQLDPLAAITRAATTSSPSELPRCQLRRWAICGPAKDSLDGFYSWLLGRISGT